MILFYNSDIWYLPTLKNTLQQSLLSASAGALKVCLWYVDIGLSYINIQKICGRASPEMLMSYKLTLCIQKLYNVRFNSIKFRVPNSNQILTGRQTKFFTLKSNKFKVGINLLANIFYLLNNTIPLTWLNMSLNSFKIKCKKCF